PRRRRGGGRPERERTGLPYAPRRPAAGRSTDDRGRRGDLAAARIRGAPAPGRRLSTEEADVTIAWDAHRSEVPTLLGAIGRTPLVRLQRVVPEGVEILAKVEW